MLGGMDQKGILVIPPHLPLVAATLRLNSQWRRNRPSAGATADGTALNPAIDVDRRFVQGDPVRRKAIRARFNAAERRSHHGREIGWNTPQHGMTYRGEKGKVATE